MKKVFPLICLLLLVFVASCTRDTEPGARALMDGMWVGTGEGRGGSCDIAIVGAGGAGLSAAVAAAESGAGSIIVLEKQGIIGGLHGANRLGGNGVADIVVNGKLAGEAAARY